MIVAAAIKYDGKIFSGKRHNDVFAKLIELGYKRPIVGVQGFVDEDGKFYTREEAAKDVIESGQLKKIEWPPLLYSEDLY